MLWSPDHKDAVLEMITAAGEVVVAVGSTSGGPILDALARRVVRVAPERVEPDPEGVAAYRELGARFRAAVERLHG